MKKIDWYIIRKFFTTFLFSIFLILILVIIFDISEKIDDFLEHDLSFFVIISDYYLHFIPYFANLFSPLFIFISVIYFTSRMASNTEIIAIYNSGMSFNRLLIPFLFCSLLLASCSFFLGNFIIPNSNKHRIDFENKYVKIKKKFHKKNIHMQIKKNQYIYIESYNPEKNIGYKFTLENFKNNQLVSKIRSNYIKYDTLNKRWRISDYTSIVYLEKGEKIQSGQSLDTTLNLYPKDFKKQRSLVETMVMNQLNEYINKEELKGSKQIVFHKIEKHKRSAFPFAIIIMTLIAVAIGSYKSKGGVGLHLGVGLVISFSYILFMQISTTFATHGNLNPLLAVWIPNILYGIVALYLIRKINK